MSTGSRWDTKRIAKLSEDERHKLFAWVTNLGIALHLVVFVEVYPDADTLYLREIVTDRKGHYKVNPKKKQVITRGRRVNITIPPPFDMLYHRTSDPHKQNWCRCSHHLDHHSRRGSGLFPCTICGCGVFAPDLPWSDARSNPVADLMRTPAIQGPPKSELIKSIEAEVERRRANEG